MLRGKIMALTFLACATSAWAQQPAAARFASVFDNAQAEVFTIELTQRSQAKVYQGTHDVLWVALNDAELTFKRRDRDETAFLKTGDVRFFAAFELTQVNNEKTASASAVLIQLKQHGQAEGCGCSTPVERAVCGCGAATHLPELWALAMGQITIGGTTLRAGQAFVGSSLRDDMLMIAVSDVDLRDDASSTPQAAIKLEAGHAKWFPAGAHQFRNTAQTGARFVTIEF